MPQPRSPTVSRRLLRALVLALGLLVVSPAGALPPPIYGPGRIPRSGFQVRFLSTLEQQVAEELNRVRTDPWRYSVRLSQMRDFFRGDKLVLPGRSVVRTQEGAGALREAVETLRRARAQRRFVISRGMSRAARDHVRDQGELGSFGHAGRDASTSERRLARYGEVGSRAAEVISYGARSAREVVMQLLLDDGLPYRPHRRSLLERRYHYLGVACGPHKTAVVMCVITLADRYREHEELHAGVIP